MCSQTEPTYFFQLLFSPQFQFGLIWLKFGINYLFTPHSVFTWYLIILFTLKDSEKGGFNKIRQLRLGISKHSLTQPESRIQIPTIPPIQPIKKKPKPDGFTSQVLILYWFHLYYHPLSIIVL